MPKPLKTNVSDRRYSTGKQPSAAFPEFEPGKTGVLFFSRGRGRGHAVPDIEIVECLHESRPDVQVRFVSYGTGARTIEAAGHELIDLGLPDGGGTAEVTALGGKLIGWLQPKIVVSHEEFAVLPVAKAFGQPTIFIGEWFVSADTYFMHTLKFADCVLLMEDQGLFQEPPYVQGRVEYFGRFLRRFDYSREDRLRARRELGLPGEAAIFVVIPGAFATEQRAPLAELLVAAFDLLETQPRCLVWVAGQDYAELRERLGHRADVFVYDHVVPPDKVMVAADAAVTKANRGSVLELRALGIPSVAVTQGDNPIDDVIVASTDGVTLLSRGEIDENTLARVLEEQVAVEIEPVDYGRDVAARVAARIATEV